MDRKWFFTLSAVAGLAVVYALVSLVVWLSRSRWGAALQKKLAVGTLLFSLTALFSHSVLAQSGETGEETVGYTAPVIKTSFITPQPQSFAPTPTTMPIYTVSPPTPTPVYGTLPPESQMGDVDGNGLVDIVDALKIARHTVGFEVEDFDESVADVDQSGTVDIVDALCVAQKYVGVIDEYPDNS